MKNKRNDDFQKGRTNREECINILNSLLANSGVVIHRVQECLKSMTIAEKNKNAVAQNMVIPAAFEKAMGLDYIITSKNRTILGPRLAIIIADSKTGIYRKVPKEYKNSPHGYLKLLKSLNYYFFIINKKEGKYSDPIPVDTAIKYWKYKMEESRGNRNRLQFSGKVSSIVLLSPDFPTLNGTIIDKLIELAK